MSTRGAIGFRLNGKDYLTYNHSDSYPDWLGRRMAEFVQEYVHAKPERTKLNFDTLREQVSKLQMIDTDVPPTAEQIAICQKAGTVDLGVSRRSTEDWYCLLRGAQGDLRMYLKLGMMPDGSEFIHDSLFCEWAYIINLDTNKLEVWQGFQHEPSPGNRYGEVGREGGMGHMYYPCKCIAEIPFVEATPDAIVALGRQDDEDED